jgi:hypothetical protein
MVDIILAKASWTSTTLLHVFCVHTLINIVRNDNEALTHDVGQTKLQGALILDIYQQCFEVRADGR